MSGCPASIRGLFDGDGVLWDSVPYKLRRRILAQMRTEAEVIEHWVRFWSQIQTPEYRAAFLVSFNPRLTPMLLDKLNIHSAIELLEAIRR